MVSSGLAQVKQVKQESMYALRKSLRQNLRQSLREQRHPLSNDGMLQGLSFHLLGVDSRLS